MDSILQCSELMHVWLASQTKHQHGLRSMLTAPNQFNVSKIAGQGHFEVFLDNDQTKREEV